MIIHQLRDLPSLGVLWDGAEFRQLRQRHGDPLVKAALREALGSRRDRLRQGQAVDLEFAAEVAARLAPSFRRVINATGTLLHTNLGRSPLGSMLAVVAEELHGYSALELDLEAGQRGRRGASVEERLRWLTGAPAVLVVNNCAAALVLLLSTHAQGREVIVSRGELVEIGGGFRIPDILSTSGARLVEVGTTNRTRISDYRKAVTPETALFLSTHPSNFKMVGYTESASAEELLALGRELEIPVAYDLGSGMLTRLLPEEPDVGQAARFPLCTFSGDKLLGGPQCGILLGTTELVEACRKHPLYRALRCDKVTLALLEETLRRHACDPTSVPLGALFHRSPEELKARAEALAEGLQASRIQAYARSSVGRVGGGSAPEHQLQSWAVSLDGESVLDLARRLRLGSPPLVGRLEKGRLLLDLLAVEPEDDRLILQALKASFT